MKSGAGESFFFLWLPTKKTLTFLDHWAEPELRREKRSTLKCFQHCKKLNPRR